MERTIINLGTYHIWIAKLFRWYFNKKKPKHLGSKLSLRFRGRGPRKHARNFCKDLPIEFARYAAVYLDVERR